MRAWVASAESHVENPFDLQPRAAAELREVVRAAWGMADRELLELCCMRMARDLDVRLDPQPPQDREPASALERAAVEYTEHFLLDPNAVHGGPDEELRRHLELPELVNFVAAVNGFEALSPRVRAARGRRGYLRARASCGSPRPSCACRSGARAAARGRRRAPQLQAAAHRRALPRRPRGVPADGCPPRLGRRGDDRGGAAPERLVPGLPLLKECPPCSCTARGGRRSRRGRPRV